MAVVFEAAGWSTLGPLALNIQAPDEGNVNLLNAIGTPEQKARWLAPLVRGEIRTVFSMTETVTDGAGSDPSLLNTIAQQDGDDFLISGRKYMITGVPGAALNIVMARTLDPRGTDLGATMFLVDMDAPGFESTACSTRSTPIRPGGHAEVSFDDVRVTPDRVLGQIGQGFRNAQVRLGPARLTHCMRWLGAARRCHAIAVEHAGSVIPSASTLGEHQGVGFMLADNEIDLHLSRLAIWHAAWLLDQHEQARDETSMTQGVLLGGAEPRGRSLPANSRLDRHHPRHRGRADLPRHPAVPHLRRPLRSASPRARRAALLSPSRTSRGDADAGRPNYDELYASFRWNIPARYNIAADVCDRHADDPDKIALIGEATTARGSQHHVPGSAAQGQSTGQPAVVARSRQGRPGHAAAGPASLDGDRPCRLLEGRADLVPASTLFAADAIAYRLNAAGVRIVITDIANLPVVGEARQLAPSVEHVFLVDGAAPKRLRWQTLAARPR